MSQHCHSSGQAQVLSAPAVTSPGGGVAETARELPWTQGSRGSLNHPANCGCAVLSWQLPYVLEQGKFIFKLSYSVHKHPPTPQRRREFLEAGSLCTLPPSPGLPTLRWWEKLDSVTVHSRNPSFPIPSTHPHVTQTRMGSAQGWLIPKSSKISLATSCSFNSPSYYLKLSQVFVSR